MRNSKKPSIRLQDVYNQMFSTKESEAHLAHDLLVDLFYIGQAISVDVYTPEILFERIINRLDHGLGLLKLPNYASAYPMNPKVYRRVIFSLLKNNREDLCPRFAKLFGFTYQKGGHHG